MSSWDIVSVNCCKTVPQIADSACIKNDTNHVTSCTVAVNNDRLLRCLTKRRELIEKLKHTLPDVSHVRDVEKLKQISDERLQGLNVFQKFLANIILGVPAMYKKLVLLNEEIKKQEHNLHFAMF